MAENTLEVKMSVRDDIGANIGNNIKYKAWCSISADIWLNIDNNIGDNIFIGIKDNIIELIKEDLKNEK